MMVPFGEFSATTFDDNEMLVVDRSSLVSGRWKKRKSRYNLLLIGKIIFFQINKLDEKWEENDH